MPTVRGHLRTLSARLLRISTRLFFQLQYRSLPRLASSNDGTHSNHKQRPSCKLKPQTRPKGCKGCRMATAILFQKCIAIRSPPKHTATQDHQRQTPTGPKTPPKPKKKPQLLKKSHPLHFFSLKMESMGWLLVLSADMCCSKLALMRAHRVPIFKNGPVACH